MTSKWAHRYISTACEHATGENRPELHTKCRHPRLARDTTAT